MRRIFNMVENELENRAEQSMQKVPKRILSSLLASISAGVVPRSGAPYIAIGRSDEIKALLSDLEEVSEGGGRMRFLVGRYGSGKSFLIQLIRGYALERNFITADADLSPERRLYGSGGGGIATYRELMKNLASKSAPDGAALGRMISRWIDGLRSELVSAGAELGSDAFERRMSQEIFSRLRDMEELVGGFDFANVMSEYYKAYVGGADEKRSACMRWFRGEFATKTEARNALGFPVSVIAGDENWYDFIKIWAVFVRKLGYRGLVVFIDECVNLYKINHRVSRENNYEKILSMFNDTLQGRAEGLEIVLGGTPQFLEDTRRGLFSYEALRSRLCDSRFASSDFKNTVGPVIRLRRLSDEELYALLGRVTKLYAQYYGSAPRITDEEIGEFLRICLARAGADTMITPREMLRDYMTVLNILMQNENTTFESVVGEIAGKSTAPSDDNSDALNNPNASSTPNDIEPHGSPSFDPNDIIF